MRSLIPAVLVLLLVPRLAGAGYREDFEKEFMTKAWSGKQVEEDICLTCHAAETIKAEFRGIVDDWRASWHAAAGVSCTKCHGGDPRNKDTAMSHEKGFLGTPKYADVPAFCGKCHKEILQHYLESGHSKALAKLKGPNCITCHGAHRIERATIDIISEQRCSRCHSYGRAKVMKAALAATEKRIDAIEDALITLRSAGANVDADATKLFAIQGEFRALFHSIDVSLVTKRTDEFAKRLGEIEKSTSATADARKKKSLTVTIAVIVAAVAVVLFFIFRAKKK